jgi:putative alpha-1,2-mannosidase
MYRSLVLLCLSISFLSHAQNPQPAQTPVSRVNVFLGTSGDHGQLSPAASSPFSLLSIGPQTYPNTHTGYEHKAKIFLGFTHNRIEGVGCMGSGGNIMITPFTGDQPDRDELIKANESASPGYYSVGFTNGIRAAFTVRGRAGIEIYQFPAGPKGIRIDLAHALKNKFLAEEHVIAGSSISGWIESGTTCREGVYRIYYCLTLDRSVQWTDSAHILIAKLPAILRTLRIDIALSSVSAGYAREAIDHGEFATVAAQSRYDWNDRLSALRVTGDPSEAKLFYSLLYRTLQTPYNITEPDGAYRAIDGTLQHTRDTIYDGWAIWDNYRTELPLLSLLFPRQYQQIANSIANLYPFGKQNWATKHEPSNTVRTEHAIVVLLDAYRKGYQIDFAPILDSLTREADSLDFAHPDKALESCYDAWALSQICGILHHDSLAAKWLQKAHEYKKYWIKDFADLSRPDVDRLEARGMYQGTVWQYRWAVPFDAKGLIALCGGDSAFTSQLDEFFAKDYYNAANEPDIEAPWLYNATTQPWKSQAMIHKYAIDTVIQYYYDLNYRGIDPTIDRVFNNRPDAFIKSMDDDAGAMSAWYILAAIGLSPACPGWPVYYLNVPLFTTVSFNWPNGKPFRILTLHATPQNKYIASVTLNGKPLDRDWITQQEIMAGGEMIITASPMPNKKFGTQDQWITSLADPGAQSQPPARPKATLEKNPTP